MSHLSTFLPDLRPNAALAPIATMLGFLAMRIVNRSDGHTVQPEERHYSHARFVSAVLSQQTRLRHPSTLAYRSHDSEGNTDLGRLHPAY